MNTRQVHLLRNLKKQLGVGPQRNALSAWLPALLALLISIAFTFYLHLNHSSKTEPGYHVMKVNHSGPLTSDLCKG